MLKYIGAVTITNIRDFILDNNLTEETIIALHPHTYDELAIDYRRHYGDGFTMPLSFLGIKLISDNSGKTVKDRVRLASESEDQTQWIQIKDIPSGRN